VRYNPHHPDWHKVEDIPPDITLAEYAAAWIDMEPHIDTLAALAREAKVIVEFGVRGGVSTWAMLDAMPAEGDLYGVDIDPNAPIPPRVIEDPRFGFVVGDSLKVALPEHADLVMIDSSHEFTQTVMELHRAASLTPSVILCHDYLYEHSPQVHRAVDGFVAPPYTDDHWDQVPYRIGRVEFSRWGLAVLVPR
jgi:hypothetical protein